MQHSLPAEHGVRPIGGTAGCNCDVRTGANRVSPTQSNNAKYLPQVNTLPTSSTGGWHLCCRSVPVEGDPLA